MKKLLLACTMALGIGASAQILVNEGFEGSTTPAGWAYTGFSRTTTSPRFCTGAAALSRNFDSSNLTGNVVYSSTASNATAMTVEFSYKTLEFSPASGVGGDFKVEYSVNNGTTYTQLGSTVVYSTILPCTTWSNTIPAGTIPAGASFKLRISGNRTAGDYWFIIDDVKLLQQVTSAPACTTVSAPANAATNVSATPTITYAASAGTASYLLNLGTTSGGTNVLNAYNNGTSLSYTLPTTAALQYNTMYYLSVQPSNSIGTATGCTETTFTTGNIPCPSVSSPATAATGTGLRPTISWAAVVGATGYNLSVGTTAGGTNILNNSNLGNVLSYTFPTNLNPSTQYFYTVTAYQGSSVSSGCTERNFTTGTIVPPANDDCVNAVTLTVNPDLACGVVTAGNTLGASLSMAAAPCFGTPDDDVWYKFVATATSHVVSLTNVVSTGTASSTDTYFQVLSGPCGTGTSLLCSDPNTGTVSGLTVGNTYYIRVYSYYGAGYNQSFNICVGTLPPPPSNDACSGATAVSSLPYSFTQDAISATNNSGFVNGANCSQAMNDGVWYSFVGDGTTITVALTGVTGWDPALAVYQGTCGNFTCAGLVDDGGSGSGETFSFPSTAGTTYYVNVGHYSSTLDSSEGPFTIGITSNNVLSANETAVKPNLVALYPNPFTDVLHLNDVKNVETVTISEMSGRTAKSFARPSAELNVSSLKTGMYLVTLKYRNGEVKTVKVIKK